MPSGLFPNFYTTIISEKITLKDVTLSFGFLGFYLIYTAQKIGVPFTFGFFILVLAVIASTFFLKWFWHASRETVFPFLLFMMTAGIFVSVVVIGWQSSVFWRFMMPGYTAYCSELYTRTIRSYEKYDKHIKPIVTESSPKLSDWHFLDKKTKESCSFFLGIRGFYGQ